MILVCGGLADAVTELVCARLAACGFSYRLLDLGVYPAGFKVKWHWRESGPSGYIAGDDWSVDLAELTGVYVRYVGAEGRSAPKGIPEDSVATVFCEYDTGLMVLLEDLPCVVVNRTGGGMSNNSKAYQALLIRESGLMIPPTLVTNDPEEAYSFYEQCGRNVIYKSLSGIRSIVRRLEPADRGRLSLLEHGPAQFQSYIPGQNVRVHTVGDQLFATRVHSQAVDYRYAHAEGFSVNMEPTTIPPPVEDSCRRLARRLDLPLTGIDLKETLDGQYYCFEVNPCPGFLFYERQTGQPISTALAVLLRDGARPSLEESRTSL